MSTFALSLAVSLNAEPHDIPSLIDQARRGDRGAFETLMRRHERQVLMTAFRLLGGNMDAAQDAAQDVFLRLHRSLSQFRGNTNFPGWLYRMTVNVCHDHRRSTQRRGEVLLDPSLSVHATDATQYDNIHRNDQRRLLTAAIERLPEKERTAIILRDIEGLDTSEVATILGSSEATVRSQICSARRKIRDFIERKQR